MAIPLNSGATTVMRTGAGIPGDGNLDNSIAVSFGADTLASAGGFPKPAGATAISDAGGTNLVLSSGDAVPDTGGGVTSGDVTWDDGTVWNVTAEANTYSFKTTAELTSAITDNGTTGGTTFVMRDGSDALTTQTPISTDFVSQVTIKAENYRAATLGRFLVSGSNIKFDRLNFSMPLNASHLYLMQVNGSSNDLTFDYCFFECTEDMTAYDFATNGSASWPIGIGPNASTDNITIRGCRFENLRRGILLSGDTIETVGCWFENCADAFINIPIGNNLKFNDNVGQGLYSAAGDFNGAHAAIGPGWGNTGTCTSYEIIGNRMFVTDRRFSNQGDTHANGVRGLSFDYSPATKHTGILVHHNISVGSNGSGDMDGIGTGNIYYNTFARDPLAAVGALPNTFNTNDIGANCLISKNIGFAAVTGTPSTDFYHVAGYDNAPHIGHNGLSGDYDVEINFDNYAAELTPKANTYWEGKGAIQSDFTFATGVGTESYVAHVDNSSIPTIPETATTTGQTIAGYTFDGTNDWLDGVTMTLGGNVATIMIGFELTDDTDDCYVFRATGTSTDVYLRRVAAGGMILNTGSSGASYYVSTNGWQAADGVQNVVILLDGDSGEVTIYVNGYRADITESAGATRFAESFTYNFGTEISVMATNTGGSKATGDLSYFWMSDVFLDLESQTILNAVCAQDGGAPNFDANGGISSASIAQPKIYIHAGNANGIEDNLGSDGASSDFTVNGSPTAPP